MVLCLAVSDCILVVSEERGQWSEAGSGIGGILSSIHDPAIICQSVSLFSYSNNTLEQSSQQYLTMGKTRSEEVEQKTQN